MFPAFSSKEKLYEKARETIQRIQETLKINDKFLSDLMGITEKELIKFKAARGFLTLQAFTKLSESLKLNIENLYYGYINYEVLDAHYNQNLLYIPEHYLVGAGSKFWSVINILNYVEHNCGWHMKVQTLRHFQLSEKALLNPDQAVNFRFMTDLLAYLGTKLMRDSSFFYTGQNIAKTLDKPELVNELRLYKHEMKSVYDVFFNNTISYIDKNYFYKIHKLDHYGSEIRMEPNANIAEAMKWKNPGSVNTCTYRAGVLSSVPHYLNLPASKVKKLSCVHRGDTWCKYHIQFPMNQTIGGQYKIAQHMTH